MEHLILPEPDDYPRPAGEEEHERRPLRNAAIAAAVALVVVAALYHPLAFVAGAIVAALS